MKSYLTTEAEIAREFGVKLLTPLEINDMLDVRKNIEGVIKLPYDELSKEVIRVGSFLVYLDTYVQVKKVIATRIEEEWKRSISLKVMEDRKKFSKCTIDEKEAIVLHENPDLEDLWVLKEKSITEYDLLRNKLDSLKEYLNALKKRCDGLRDEYNNKFRTLN